jgi:hypothetical protein
MYFPVLYMQEMGIKKIQNDGYHVGYLSRDPILNFYVDTWSSYLATPSHFIKFPSTETMGLRRLYYHPIRGQDGCYYYSKNVDKWPVFTQNIIGTIAVSLGRLFLHSCVCVCVCVCYWELN